MDRITSKQYFISSIRGVLPDRNIPQNPSIVDTIINTLACFIPDKKSSISMRFKRKLLNYSLEEKVFNEILKCVAGKEKLDEKEVAYVCFLEQEGFTYAANWIESLRSIYNDRADIDEDILMLFRQHTPKGQVNTCCYNCGKTLERHGGAGKNPHFCTRSEDKSCFDEMKKIAKQKGFEWKMINRRCLYCGENLTFSVDMSKNHYHKDHFFCSEKHYEAYRKNIQRNDFSWLFQMLRLWLFQMSPVQLHPFIN